MRPAVPRLLALVVLIAACAPMASPSSSPTPVSTDRVTILEPSASIETFVYSPGLIQVAAGTKVTWHNAGQQFHTVTSDSTGRPFDLSVDPGKEVTFTFVQIGTFPYHCGVHPQMKGTVVVR